MMGRLDSVENLWIRVGGECAGVRWCDGLIHVECGSIMCYGEKKGDKASCVIKEKWS